MDRGSALDEAKAAPKAAQAKLELENLQLGGEHLATSTEHLSFEKTAWNLEGDDEQKESEVSSGVSGLVREAATYDRQVNDRSCSRRLGRSIRS